MSEQGLVLYNENYVRVDILVDDLPLVLNQSLSCFCGDLVDFHLSDV